MPQKQSLPWFRYLPAGLTLCAGVALSAVAFALVWRWEDNRRDYEFNRYAEGAATSLQQHLKEDLQVIPNVADFFAASSFVERSSFSQFLGRRLSSNRSIQLLAWVPRVGDAQRQEFEEEARSQGYPDFQIAELDSRGQIVPAQQRREYFPAYYVEPRKGNQTAEGLDLACYPALRAALERARDTGKMVVARESELLLENGTQPRLLAIWPIYRQQGDPVSPSQLSLTARRDSLEGFAVGVFRVSEIFKAALAGRGASNFDLYLTDTVEIDPDRQDGFFAFYDSSRGQVVGLPSAQKPRQLNGTPSRHEAVGRRTLEVGGRQWFLYVLSTPAYREIQTKYWRSWATLLIGLLWTNIPVTYLLTSLSRTRQIEQLAQERARQAEQLELALQQLSAEQEKSERLLLNILPEAIAERLKQQQQIIADSFPEVTVLFADIVGFTQLASRICATELVQLLNELVSAFDRLAVRHGLEKIKTIGDAYMVVGGLPAHRPDHAEAIAEMATDMLQEVARFSLKRGESLRLRIGIHTGPVVAGVIGTHKFIYDLWGDTVNIASRMESHGLPDCIQVSAATYELLRDKYQFQQRGRIPIKGKGEMTTYLLTGRQAGGVSKSPLFLPAGISRVFKGSQRDRLRRKRSASSSVQAQS